MYGDPVGLSDPTGEIAPAVTIAYKVVLAGGAVLTGLEAYNCAEYLWDPCLYADQVESCKNSGIDGALTLVGLGWLRKTAVATGGIRNFGVLKKIRGLPGLGRFFGGAPKFPKLLNISNNQFGKKFGPRARELGIDPRNARIRYQFRDRIQRIFDNADEIRRGTFRGQDGDVFFFRRGRDVVLTKPNGDYITILTGGTTSKRFINATRVK